MFWRGFFLIVLAIFLMLALAGCIPGDGKHTENGPVGFFWGIWHGWIAPISLIVGLFRSHIRIYEVINTGWWYDLGFYMAIIGGFGGLAFARKSNKNDK